jgi:N-acetylglucosaminyldiphosphoundecaprenol N-acetyl-beta-D-mannosaminyltransferase
VSSLELPPEVCTVLEVSTLIDKPTRVNVLGVGISAINLPLAVEFIEQALRNRRKGYICVADAHSVVQCRRSSELRAICNRSFMTTPDGMPVVWMSRLLGAPQVARVYGPDLMLEVLKVSASRGYRHFLYGGVNGTAEALRERLVARFPGLQVTGTYEPPFRPLNPSEAHALSDQVKASRPDIMWVGISTPKQEKFMAEYLPKLDVTLMFGVGAAFNFHSGRVREAPLMLQRCGLQWLHRCFAEPRLWQRYLRVVPSFLFHSVAQLSGLKRYSVEDACNRGQ